MRQTRLSRENAMEHEHCHLQVFQWHVAWPHINPLYLRRAGKGGEEEKLTRLLSPIHFIYDLVRVPSSPTCM